jgi:hypothetical protein
MSGNFCRSPEAKAFSLVCINAPPSRGKRTGQRHLPWQPREIVAAKRPQANTGSYRYLAASGRYCSNDSFAKYLQRARGEQANWNHFRVLE